MISKMKVYIYTSIALAFLLLSSCGNDKNEIFNNEPYGFRDYKWGTKFDEIEGLEISDPVAVKFDLPYYEAVKTNENLDFYGTRASEITYYFEDDLLVGVMVSLPSKESFETAKEYCFNIYGKIRNKEKLKEHEEYLWVGEKTQIKLSHYSYQKPPFYVLITFSSSYMEREPKIETETIKLSYLLDSMQLQIQVNKRSFCALRRYLVFLDDYEDYGVYLCKLYDLIDKETN